ncbi:MAG: uracil-DNA glycosylase [Hyphomicrobiales bacterium]|nr:uracil-DNA glycosylase [Hyphomicrobiales bacterium]
MRVASNSNGHQPAADCALCPRLATFRNKVRLDEPDWFNSPVPSWGGDGGARLLIVGLAPGLRGANRTGRPFTGDHAGILLYATLAKFGFSRGSFAAAPDDGLSLVDCRITNAVRCVPPQNKPLPAEISQCRQFLEAELGRLPGLACVVALGRIAHEATIKACGQRLALAPFSHGAVHRVATSAGRMINIIDSYHCSRYNTNTGVLTPAMFDAVFAQARRLLDG